MTNSLKKLSTILHQYTIDEMIDREKKYFNQEGDPLPWEDEVLRPSVILKRHPRKDLYSEDGNF